MTELRILLSQGIQVFCNGRRIPGLESSMPGVLLAYLALEAPRPHQRPALANMLWPNRTEQDGLGSLRFALSNLRSALEERQAAKPFLLVDRRVVRLNPQAEIWVDVLEFRKHAAECEAQALAGQPPTPAALRAVLDLYRGGFFSGLIANDSNALENWVQIQREQLDRLRQRLLHLLAAACEQAGQAAQAEEAYQAMLAYEPLDEITQRRLMRLLDARGQRPAALAQYEAFRQSLRVELGVEPQTETIRLYQAIKSQTPASGGAQAWRAVMPFVGRQREVDSLKASLEHTLTSLGQVVLVTGEAGSGKTALLSEFARQALERHPDILVAGGRCNAYSGFGQPYLPFVESLQMLAGEWDSLPWANSLEQAHEERLHDALGRVAQSLVETAPDLIDRFVGRARLAQRVARPPGSHLPWLSALLQKHPEQPISALETGALFEQITRLLTELARRNPLILLLDDFQWVDPGSAALLFHLTRRCASSRLLMVVSYRSGEVLEQTGAEEHPLKGILTELRRFPGSLLIDLDRLDENSFSSAFLENDPFLKPNRLDSDFCEALARHTGGNPLFIAELLRNLQVSGDLHRDAGGTWVSSPNLNWQRLPERIEASIAGRIARLPERWVDWLSTASVEGESFTAEVLARVHGLDEPALHRDLNGPLNVARGAYRLLQFEGVQWLGEQRLSRYRFRHILFQSYLFEQMNPAERSRRHAEVGRALAALYAGAEQPGQYASELARQFEAAGEAKQAAGYWLQAGQYAMYLAAAETAISNYQRGLALLAGLSATPERDRLEIQLNISLAAALNASTGWSGKERGEALQRALDRLRRVGKENDLSELFPVLFGWANWLLIRDPLLSGQISDEMLTLAGDQPGLPLALACWSAGTNRFFLADMPAARAYLERGLAVYEASGQPATQALIGTDLAVMSHAWLGAVLVVMGFPDQAWVHNLQACQRAEALGWNFARGSSIILAGVVAVERGDFSTLCKQSGDLVQMGKEWNMPLLQAFGWIFAGEAALMGPATSLSQAHTAVEAFRQGIDLFHSINASAIGQMWYAHLAVAMLKAGQNEAGLDLVVKDIQKIERAGLPERIGAELFRVYGELLLAAAPPRREEAETWLLRSIRASQQAGALMWELKATLNLARLWQAERPAEAYRLLTDVTRRFTEGWGGPNLKDGRSLLAALEQRLGYSSE